MYWIDCTCRRYMNGDKDPKEYEHFIGLRDNKKEAQEVRDRHRLDAMKDGFIPDCKIHQF